MSEIDNATLNNKLLSELELSNKKKLELISLDRMLEVNIEKNVSKNKIIYTLFSFILLVLLIMIIIKINN
jgi:hypothetical protein